MSQTMYADTLVDAMSVLQNREGETTDEQLAAYLWVRPKYLNADVTSEMERVWFDDEYAEMHEFILHDYTKRHYFE